MTIKSKDPWAKKTAKGMKTLISILKTGEKVVKVATSTPKTKKTAKRTYSNTRSVSSYSSYNSLYSTSTSTKRYHPTNYIVIGVSMIVLSLILMYFIISYFKGLGWPFVGFFISIIVAGFLGGFGLMIAMDTKAVDNNCNAISSTDINAKSVNVPSSNSSFDYNYWIRSYNIVNDLWSFTEKLNLDWGFHKSTGELKGVNIVLKEKVGFEDTFVGKVRFLVMCDIAENIKRGGHVLNHNENVALILFTAKIMGASFLFSHDPNVVYNAFISNYNHLSASCADLVNQAIKSKPSVEQIFLLSYATHDYSETLQKEYLSYMLKIAELFASVDNDVDTIEKNWINTIKNLKIGQ